MTEEASLTYTFGIRQKNLQIFRGALIASSMAVALGGYFVSTLEGVSKIAAYALYSIAAMEFFLALLLPPLLQKYTPLTRMRFFKDHLLIAYPRRPEVKIEYAHVERVEEAEDMTDEDRAAGLVTIHLHLSRSINSYFSEQAAFAAPNLDLSRQIRMDKLPMQDMPLQRIKEIVEKSRST